MRRRPRRLSAFGALGRPSLEAPDRRDVPELDSRELRDRGHDVASVHEAPGTGTTDEAVLHHARLEERALVTENVRDFRPLAEALLAGGGSHSGLVFTTDRRWPRTDPGALIRALEALLASTPEQPVDSELWL